MSSCNWRLQGKKRQAKVRVGTTANKVEINTFDAVIIPGGYAPDKMRLHQSMIDLVKKAYDQGKVVAAICHGPQLLISADIVRGHRVTSSRHESQLTWMNLTRK